MLICNNTCFVECLRLTNSVLIFGQVDWLRLSWIRHQQGLILAAQIFFWLVQDEIHWVYMSRRHVTFTYMMHCILHYLLYVHSLYNTSMHSFLCPSVWCLPGHWKMNIPFPFPYPPSIKGRGRTLCCLPELIQQSVRPRKDLPVYKLKLKVG